MTSSTTTAVGGMISLTRGNFSNDSIVAQRVVAGSRALLLLMIRPDMVNTFGSIDELASFASAIGRAVTALPTTPVT
jgi:hypothetical protein